MLPLPLHSLSPNAPNPFNQINLVPRHLLVRPLPKNRVYRGIRDD